ncbi:MAG: thioredoxin domain-containing protein [Alphaproteobacteria bacterium]|nr:thioredoxin domain-containing protein [Alphaproteobacteria bacterium]
MTGILWRLAFVLLLVTGGAGEAAAERNALDTESSPYLQLHATDPVHWRAWSPETLAQAKAAGKPILLSIGYSSCHWCHVMRREAFSDPETADVINRLFFPILLDREERPDIDAVYQSAANAMSLPTGWPLNMFLTPGAKPFWGGTYFPKDKMRGMAAFKDTLKQVSGVYTGDPEGVAADAGRVAQFLRQSSKTTPGTITVKTINAAAKTFLLNIDPFYGGFGEAPKFPYLPALEMLWRAHIRTGEKEYADAVRSTLAHMLAGGLYDHVGGGFFRYAVDGPWRVPHYEKMLDVNAGMVRLMTEVWRETGDADLKKTVRQTVGFLLADMLRPDGAFAGSLDADSLNAKGHEMEGVFYLWDMNQAAALLGADGPLFAAAFATEAPENTLAEDYGETGTLYRTDKSKADLAKAFDLSPEDVDKRLGKILGVLKRHRAKRHRPRRDDKIIADWSGMAIAAVTEAGMAFARGDWVIAASKAFDATNKALTATEGAFKDRLHHSVLTGKPGAPATLRGLAEMSRAALILFEATGNSGYLEHARIWVATATRHHWDENGGGGFFSTDADAGPAMARLKPVLDQPNTSGNGKMIEVLALLYYLDGDGKYHDRASRALRAVGGTARDAALEVSGLYNAADTLDAALQIVVIGRRGDGETDRLARRVMTTSLPNRALDIIGPGTVLPEGHPARYKEQLDGKATAYVCRGSLCSLPVTDAGMLKETLLMMRQSGNK